MMGQNDPGSERVSFDALQAIRQLEQVSGIAISSGDGHWAILALMGARSLCELLQGTTRTAVEGRLQSSLERMQRQGIMYDGWTHMHEWFGAVIEWLRIEFPADSKCWLCNAQPSDPASTATEEMRKELFKGYKIKVYSRRTILIPRCSRCATDSSGVWGLLLFLLMALTGLAGFIATRGVLGITCLVIGAIAGGYFGIQLTRRLSKSRGIVRALYSWPPLVEAREEGFRSGAPDRLAAHCYDIIDLCGSRTVTAEVSQ